MASTNPQKHDTQTPLGGDDRIAIVEGARTPFAKAWTEFKDWNEADLGRVAVRELVERSEVDPELIDDLVMGCVSAPMNGPNVAREVVLRTPLPRTIPAYTVQMYCASSALSAVNAAGDLMMGGADVAIAAGVESTSASQARVSLPLTQALNEVSKAKSPIEMLQAFKDVDPKDLLPDIPAIAEPTTGERMGNSGEKMAKKYGISQRDQDEYAAMSHHRAAEAFEEGRFPEVVPVTIGPDHEEPVERDPMIRPDTSAEQMAGLSPAFDKEHGSITAGNASPLTDGAAAVMMMRESTARELGIEPKAYIRSWATTGVDLFEMPMLMGPTFATPKALARGGVELEDMDLVEMHEAFAAQILANVRVWESDELCRELGLEGAIGDVDMDIFNINGGSIPIGHPFGATGARMIMQLAGQMERRDESLGLLTLCAAGGLGLSMVLERG
ncbi:MAG: acetyl-CoA C-acyltransferase [Bradymonadaceae bacterium]